MPIPLGILAVAGAGAGAAGAFDLLETTVLSSAASSVTFSSLGSYSDYKHLQIRMTLRTVEAATGAGDLRFNLGVGGGSYAWHYLRGNNGSVVSTGFGSAFSIESYKLIAKDNEPANAFGAAVFDILDFSNSSKNTTIRGLGGYASNTGSLSAVSLNSGLLNNTSAVTSITINYTSNLAAGSRFSLYGIK